MLAAEDVMIYKNTHYLCTPGDSRPAGCVCVCVCVCVVVDRAGRTDIKLNNHSTTATAASITKHVGHEKLL